MVKLLPPADNVFTRDPNKLNRRQVSQLGGLASARAAGAAGMAARGSKGGRRTVETLGREHFVQAARKRWDKLTRPADANGVAAEVKQ